MRNYFWPIVIAIALLLLFFGSAIVSLYTNWLWFDDLGYSTVFLTKLFTQIKMGLVLGFLFFAVIYGNLWYARRIAPTPSPTGLEQQLMERVGQVARRLIGILIFIGSVVISAMVGLEAATNWEKWLLYTNATPFGANDPAFHRDVGFYVFSLPFLKYIYHWLFFALVASTIAAIALHFAGEALESIGGRLSFAPGVKTHLSVLVAAMFFLKAWGYRLSMFDLVNARGNLFDGAGYTELHANLPALWILLVLSIIGGIVVLIGIGRRGVGYAATAFGVLVGASVLIGAGYPAAIQSLSVKPNELEKQRPYIERAIKATQDAYALSTVAGREFAAEPSLSANQLAANEPTIENVRLWDEDHLKRAYNQIQTIQQYYHFQDVDVDRYWLAPKQGGEPRYRQVWLGARELSEERLPASAKTWINRHLQYTHGYGYVMSPVNEITKDGDPQFFVKDIPPVPTVDLPVNRMGIYFGEMTDDYVFVKTSAEEFDYPTGGQHKATTYKGSGGVGIGGFFRKLMFALQFSDMNILLNENLKADSRILYVRNIKNRTERLLPFLQFDNDPYLVTANGNLYWMRDAYTYSDAYPYSAHVRVDWPVDVNYIRNSVKVVVDAYSGEVTAYIMDKPLRDPIIHTYNRIFKGIFRPYSAMPKELQEHVRYAEDQFRLQTLVYTRYHYPASDPDAFYRNNDNWEIPNKAYVTGAQSTGAEELMEPYYVIMKLPNGSAEEMILMTPYVRSGERKNMVAWMCARCDEPAYGTIVLYQFPEDKNVYGPQQIAGLASQDTTISQQLSLWNQQGSSVGSGNLLVIPIEDSLLYVMPIYLSSTGTQIPQVKRVIVAVGGNISMEPTLGEALERVVGAPIPTAPSMAAPSTTAPPAGGAPGKPGVPAGAAPSGDVKRLIDQAVSQYDKAQAAQRSGNWAEYGRQTAELRKTLEELRSKAR